VLLPYPRDCSDEKMGDLLKAFSPNEMFQGLDSLVERGEIRAIICGSGSLKSVILKSY